jgi:type II secretion system protein G
MKKRGFTLMEVLIVIAILGILATMVMANFKASQQKSRDIRRKSDLSQIGKALEIYNNDFGSYPLADADGNIKGCGAGGIATCTWGTSQFANTTSTVIYMAKLPNDPITGLHYRYRSDGTGTYYQLYSYLENPDSPGYHDYSGILCGADGSGDVNCKFGIASTNTTP